MSFLGWIYTHVEHLLVEHDSSEIKKISIRVSYIREKVFFFRREEFDNTIIDWACWFLDKRMNELIKEIFFEEDSFL